LTRDTQPQASTRPGCSGILTVSNALRSWVSPHLFQLLSSRVILRSECVILVCHPKVGQHQASLRPRKQPGSGRLLDTTATVARNWHHRLTIEVGRLRQVSERTCRPNFQDDALRPAYRQVTPNCAIPPSPDWSVSTYTKSSAARAASVGRRLKCFIITNRFFDCYPDPTSAQKPSWSASTARFPDGAENARTKWCRAVHQSSGARTRGLSVRVASTRQPVSHEASVTRVRGRITELNRPRLRELQPITSDGKRWGSLVTVHRDEQRVADVLGVCAFIGEWSAFVSKGGSCL
jgi:hypothetical protein